MNVQLDLTNNRAFPWYKNNNFYCRGYIFNKDNFSIFAEDIFSYFHQSIEDEVLFENLVKLANGCFVIIFINQNNVVIVSDRVRTFNLFYRIDNDTIFITDEIHNLLKNGDKIRNENYLNEFLTTSFVTGRDTIYNNIKQLRASEILKFDGLVVKNIIYYNFKKSINYEHGIEYYKSRYTEILNNVARRLINGANNRQIVIPLSSGHDSRLIANMLYLHGYKNVLCFTYGKKDSFEIPVAKKVAAHLGFKWLLIEYSDELLNNFSRSSQFEEWVRYSSQETTIPHLQDYFSIDFLVKNNLIDKDAIIVPGHRLIMNLFNYIYIHKNYDKFDKDLAFKMIVSRHFKFEKILHRKILKDKILYYLGASEVFEEVNDWQTKEYYSKMLINSVRTYEFFGFEHRMPLIDNEIIEFFDNLPLENKISPNIFYEHENESLFFSITKTNFEATAYPAISHNKLFNIIKKSRIFKKFNRKYGHHFMTKYNDVNNFSTMIKELMPEVKLKGNPEKWFNGNIAKWYVENFIK